MFGFRDFPDYPFYSTPVYFQSDWLNEFWDSRTDCLDDYRFVYIGPRGSWYDTHTHTHTFNGPLFGTTQVSRYLKGTTNPDLTEARDGE